MNDLGIRLVEAILSEAWNEAADEAEKEL